MDFLESVHPAVFKQSSPEPSRPSGRRSSPEDEVVKVAKEDHLAGVDLAADIEPALPKTRRARSEGAERTVASRENLEDRPRRRERIPDQVVVSVRFRRSLYMLFLGSIREVVRPSAPLVRIYPSFRFYGL